jgi:hypothetical protein
MAAMDAHEKRHATRVGGRRHCWCVDFLSEEERNRFRVLPVITEDDIRRINWEDFLRRL